MTQVQYTVEPQVVYLAVMVSIATLEQIVVALETGRWNTRAIAGWAPAEIGKDYNDDHDKINAAITAGRAALANAERVEPVPTRIERKVYKGSAEYSEYLSARFTKERQTGSFEWQSHRWAYRWTSFDDAGDFDLIYRNTSPKDTP